MRYSLPLSTVAAISVFSLVSAPRTANAQPPRGYRLAWSDEFHQTVDSLPNPVYWNYDLGNNGWGNNELENYVNDREHAHIVLDPAAEDKRALQIQLTSEGKGKYTSARLLTRGKIEIQYGYIEARIRMPYGQGVWPAFWMLGSNLAEPGNGWPRCGEIDIMENIGKQEWWGRNEGSLHGPDYMGGNSLHASYQLPEGQYFKDGYHTFGILWEKDSISFYVDGNKYETRTPDDIPGKTWVFNHPFFFIANVAIGGNFPGNPDDKTVLPQKMLIDYIRVYKPTAATTKKKTER